MEAVWRDGDLHAVVPDCRQWSGATECMAAIRLLRFGAFGDTGRPTINVTFGKRHPLDPADALYSYYLPSLEVNRFGNMAMVYHRSGASIYPEVRGSIRMADDSGMSPSFLVKAGELPVGCPASDHDCSKKDVPIKSIDNSGMAVDPFDDVGMWMVHAYGVPQRGNASTATTGGWKLVVATVFGSVHPDLRATSVAVTKQPILAGGALNTAIRIRNEGDGSASNVGVALSLARVTAAARDWMTVGELTVASIRSGQEVLVNAVSPVPGTLPTGLYELRATVDRAGRIREYNEANDTSAAIQLSIAGRVAAP
jgi:hypothetical protein